MGDDLDSMYKDGMRRKMQLEELFTKFEASPTPNSDIAMQQKLSFLAKEFSSLTKCLEQRTQELKGSQKGVWDRKAGRLSEDSLALNRALDQRLGRLFQVQKEEESRQALFGDRSSNKKLDDPSQDLAKEHRKLQESSHMLDNVLEQGRDVLRNLGRQNTTIKGARRKLLDAANVMGLSHSLVNVIERRHNMDKFIVCALMFFSFLLLFVLYYLFKW